MASSMEADISTFTKISTLEAASVAVYLYVITIEAVTLITPKIQLYPDGYQICILRYIYIYLRLWATGSRPGRLVTWSYIIRLTPRSRWFPQLVPLPESLEPHDHRIRPAPQHLLGHGLFPRIKWKCERLNMRRILIPSTICSQRYRKNPAICSDDRLVSIESRWLSLLMHMCVTRSWGVNRCNPTKHSV